LPRNLVTAKLLKKKLTMHGGCNRGEHQQHELPSRRHDCAAQRDASKCPTNVAVYARVLNYSSEPIGRSKSPSQGLLHLRLQDLSFEERRHQSAGAVRQTLLTFAGSDVKIPPPSKIVVLVIDFRITQQPSHCLVIDFIRFKLSIL
jgi:hypothetical protein